MTRRLPSVNALKCFEVVATHMSVRKASAVLCVSESAVSRQVKILEQQLGVTLFHRTPKGLSFTAEGEALAASTRAAFDQIAETVEGFDRDDDVVDIRVLPSFALRWLYPRIRTFQRQYPLIKVIIHTRWHDMISSDNDAEFGIRYGIGNWNLDDASELYRECIVPVCSPDYLSGREIQNAEDLRGATLLHSQPDHEDWKVWAKDWGGGEFDSDGGLDFDVLDMALSAAEAGFGIVASDVMLAHNAIDQGKLTMASRRLVESGTSYYLVRPSNMIARKQSRLFHDWLCDEMTAHKRKLEVLYQ